MNNNCASCAACMSYEAVLQFWYQHVRNMFMLDTLLYFALHKATCYPTSYRLGFLYELVPCFVHSDPDREINKLRAITNRTTCLTHGTGQWIHTQRCGLDG